MSEELATVARHPSDKTYPREPNAAVNRFRECIKRFKAKIYDSLDENTVDKHNPAHYKDAINRIFQLGNLLRQELRGTMQADDPETQKTVDTVRNVLKQYKLDVADLTEEERELCLHYVTIDIFTYPRAIDRSHINSLFKH